MLPPGGSLHEMLSDLLELMEDKGVKKAIWTCLTGRACTLLCCLPGLFGAVELLSQKRSLVHIGKNLG